MQFGSSFVCLWPKYFLRFSRAVGSTKFFGVFASFCPLPDHVTAYLSLFELHGLLSTYLTDISEIFGGLVTVPYHLSKGFASQSFKNQSFVSIFYANC